MVNQALHITLDAMLSNKIVSLTKEAKEELLQVNEGSQICKAIRKNKFTILRICDDETIALWSNEAGDSLEDITADCIIIK